MTGIEKILADYEAGNITRRERVIAMARLISPETIAETLSGVSPEVVEELVSWAKAAPLEDGVVIGGNLAGDEARKLAGQLRVAIRAVQEWDRQGRDHQGAETGQSGTSTETADLA